MNAINNNNKGISMNDISRDPATPKNDRKFNEDKFFEWVNAHHPDYRDALKTLKTFINYVPHNVFFSQLTKSIDSCNLNLNKFTKQKTFFLLEPGKSNQWVTELALKHLKCHDAVDCARLGEKQAKQFTTYLDSTSPRDWPKQLFVCDDASYSGTQLSEHVLAIWDKYKEQGVELELYVIAPYMTNVALDKLKSIKEKNFQAKNNKLQLNLPTDTQPMQTIFELSNNLSQIDKQNLLSLYSADKENSSAFVQDSGITATYFAHKLPNSKSFMKALGEGTVVITSNKIENSEEKEPLSPVNGNDSSSKLTKQDKKLIRSLEKALEWKKKSPFTPQSATCIPFIDDFAPIYKEYS